MIEIKNLKLNINNIDILNELSFDIPDNAVMCILGNKNSGKSSIFKVLTGTYKNYYGEVLYNGIDINDLSECKIDILHDTREKDPDITVNEYLNFYGSIYGKENNDEMDAYINDMLRKFSLMSYKYTSLDQIDNENYKLVELIRISINDPDILLFDNLFSSDNADFNEKLLEYIKGLIGKKTLVFASRSLNHIEGIVTHLAVLENGNLVACGKKEDVYKKAELSNKIELEVIDKMQDAVEVLKKNPDVTNIVYNDKIISFSIVANITYSNTRNQVEAAILKELVDNDIEVYSFKKQRVRFEQLFGRLKG
ncbi:MAG: ATP-binding cassette domain-containing protein [Lachnospiraceae bacterium]|nr:ATP-binding cassette domain-containing protein [Lachnospiraceae bacterium]